MEPVTERELNMQRWLTAAYNYMLQSLYAMHNALAMYEPKVIDEAEEDHGTYYDSNENEIEAPFTIIKGGQDIEG